MSGYIGNIPTPQATQTRDTFTATSGQTTFATSGYTPNFVLVWLNGVLLQEGTDYTASNGSDVVLTTGAATDDIVEVIAFTTFEASDVTASSGFTVTGNLSVDGGTIKLDGNYPVGNGNVAFGNQALDDSSLSGNFNTAMGNNALTVNTTGASNTGIGAATGQSITTGSYNTAIGSSALVSNTTASNNTAVGYQAAYNTTGTQNTAVGSLALQANTTGIENTAQGFAALDANTTGNYNTAFGAYALTDATTASNNTAVGRLALADNTTASEGTALGWQALRYNTTGILNTAVGAWAGHSNTTSQRNTFIGHYAGQGTTGGYNTFVGQDAGYAVTSGNRNTIIGRYSGNQSGLDIRTSNGVVVLSDGDGNVFYMGSSGADPINRFVYSGYSLGSARLVVQDRQNNYVQWYFGSTQTGSVTTNGSTTSYNTSSDYRLKENVVELTGATDRLKQIPVHRFNFIADADTTVDGFLAHEVQAIVPEAVTGTKDEVDADGNPVYQGIDQSKLVPLLVATIKELEARIATLEAN